MDFGSLLKMFAQLAQTPTGQDVLSAVGHLAETVAAHNRQHLGSADAIVADAGSLLSNLGGQSQAA